jgi:dTDP-glucose 4,6-dehydratase
MASLSDVEASIKDPVPFVQNNISLAINMLEFARKVKPKAFIQISTDEVYGPVANKNDIGVKEWGVFLPSNPYAASKAAQEMIAISYWRTYDVPVIITNTMNNFGEMQQPSKFPVMVQKWIANNEKVIIHGEKRGDKVEIGSRSYIHSRNFADALLFILQKLPAHLHTPDAVDRPDRYNIAGDLQLDNLELAKLIAKLMGKEDFEYEVVNVHTLRPGHDRHYQLDMTKLHELGWKSPLTFEESLKNTIKWQTEHKEWIA